MSDGLPLGRRVKEFSVPAAETRRRLEREVAQTDIDYDEAATRGRLRSWGYDLTYEWSVEPTDEGARVTERWWLDRAGFALFVAVLPAIAALSALVLVLFHTDLSAALVGSYAPDRSFLARTWPYLLLTVAVTGLFGLVAYSVTRLAQVPWPLEELDEDVTDERARSVLLGCLALFVIAMSPGIAMFVGSFALPWEQFMSLGVTVFPAATLVLSTACSLVVAGAVATGRLDRLELSHGLLTDIEDGRSDLVTRFQVVEARYNNMPESELLGTVSTAAERVGINLAPTVETGADGETVGGGKISRYGLEARYEWRIERRASTDGDPDYLVTETMYLPRDYKFTVHLVALLTGALLLIDSGFLPALLPATALAGPSLGPAAVTAIAFVLVPMRLFPRGLDERDPACAVDLVNVAGMRPMTLFCGLLAVGTLAPTPLATTAVGFALVGLSVLALTHYEWLCRDLHRQRSLLDLSPPLDASVSLTIGPALPALVVLLRVYGPGEWSPVALAALAAAGLVTTWVFGRMAVSLRSLGVALFESRGDEDAGAALRWAAYAVTAAVSVAAVVAPVAAADHALTALGGPSNSLAVVVAAVYLVPAALPVAGVVYQVGTVSRDVRALFAASRPVSPAAYDLAPDLIDAELRVYDGPIDGVCGLSTLRRDAVFLPERTAEAVSTDELAALVAHEDAHASVYNDGLLSVSSPLLAGVTFTGRNVLLAALNFRAREFRADRYAARRVSGDALADALRAVSTRRSVDRADDADLASDRSPAAAFTSFAPGTGPSTRAGALFGLLYGDYTLTRAHPTVDERVDRVSDDGAADSSDDGETAAAAADRDAPEPAE